MINSTLGVTATKINNATVLKLTLLAELNNSKIGAFINTAIDTTGTGNSKATYLINHTNETLYWSLFGVNSSINIASYNDSNIHKIELIYNGVDVKLYIDNTLLQTIIGVLAYDTYSYTQFGKYKYGIRQGLCSYVRLENQDGKIFEVNMAEGNGSTLYDAVSGDAIPIYDATLATFWGTKQDIFHYNFLNGFDLWENGTAGQEIRVPIGANVTQTGYSYSDTYQAGKWHNNAESKIQLPATLKAVVDGDCPNPLSYDEFQTNFNSANDAFSNVHEKQHKQLVFYNRALTTAELLKIQKCLNVKNSENVLTDGNGNVLTDENGLILVGE